MKGLALVVLFVLSCLSVFAQERLWASNGTATAASAADQHKHSAKKDSEVPRLTVLTLGAELAWEDVYVGDPLRVTVRLSSPRARQEAHLFARKIERGEQISESKFVAPVVTSKAFAPKVEFQLFKFRRDGARERVLVNADWQSFLIKEESDVQLPEEPFGLQPLIEEWMVPPDVMAKPGGGRYALAVAWAGKGVVDASLLNQEGKLEAEILTFEIKAITDNRQRAANQERLAAFEFAHGQYKEAQAHGQAALRLDPDTFTAERLETYLLIADAAVALEDYVSAAATYRDLLKRLPPPERDDLALSISERLKMLEQIK